MNTIIKLALAAAFILFAQNVMGQEGNETLEKDKQQQIEYLREKQQSLIQIEKESLKRQVRAIMELVEKGEITESEAEKRKQKVALNTAQNIENESAIIENQIALIERNGKVNNDIETQVAIGLGLDDGDGKRVFGVTVNNGKAKNGVRDTGTESNPIVTFGVNTALVDGEGIGDDFSLTGGYIGLGWDWTTALSKETNFWRVRYGFEFQFNKLRLKNDLAFVKDRDQTITEEFDVALDNAKFRQTNLVVPLHFEFGGKKKRTYGQGRAAHHYGNKVIFGLGGYGGINLSNVQKLTFENDGDKVKQKTRGDFNTSDFVYGVSAYLGYNGWGLFAKYDLNPTFKDNPIEQRNLSLGVRLFLN